MKVIIDTNIYLNFYRKRADESLLFIKALIDLVKKGKFQLILPVQVKNEFLYNKEQVVKEQLIALDSGLDVKVILPDFIKKSREVKRLKSAVKTLIEVKNCTIVEYKKRAFNPRSNINKGISNLFKLASVLDGTELIQRAYFRNLQGFPPRKDNRSFGDAIIWETLLEHCSDDDLTIISADGDYSSDEKPKKIHSFLEAEWSDKTNGKTVVLYDNLGKFINDISPKINKPISKELIEKDDYQLSSGILDIAKAHLVDQSSGLVRFGEHVTTAFGITSQICSCCGKSFQSNPYSLTTFTGSWNKCPDCAGLFVGECKTCRKCNKHYHDGLTSFSLTTFENLCPDCQSTRGISITDNYIN